MIWGYPYLIFGNTHILLSNFFWRPVSSDSIPRSVCVTRDGTNETYLAQYTWYDDLKWDQINQTMTLFSSYEPFFLVAIFGWLFSFGVALSILRLVRGVLCRKRARFLAWKNRGQTGERWERSPNETGWMWPEVLRFWQHKVEASCFRTQLRWMAVDL